MTRGRDGAEHRYEEVDMSGQEQIRVTYIPHQDWAKSLTLRIQKRAYRGRVSRGTEFSAASADEFLRAVQEVLSD
jgi:hypothetical protein